MSRLEELQKRFGDLKIGKMGFDELVELQNGLKDITPDEINSVNGAKLFIELLRKYREAVAFNDTLHGENYPDLLQSLLSVGQNGLYSNDLRFIFELIQNVDDCDYPSTDDCRLDIQFDFNANKIILKYNEVGFTPFNVFAITGIAVAAKNIDSTKNQIGEKGIGFKSVFGVADTVLIQSGWFSFKLHKSDFTIPESFYESEEYIPVLGTKMILYVSDKQQQLGKTKTEKIYNEIKRRYYTENALFNQNPLLFLNKLTSLTMYFDSLTCMEFKVSRSGGKNVDYINIDADEKVFVERNVEVSVNLSDRKNQKVEKSFSCTRYFYPVVFSGSACRARYGNKADTNYANGKKLVLQAIMPNQEYVDQIGFGSLYSFLPTQLKFTVPILCHVPFKLDASREFVDPQNENEWFQTACEGFSKLIDFVYLDWSRIVKEDIVKYLPGKKESLIASNNGKEQCISTKFCFRGEHYLGLPLFFSSKDDSYHTDKEIFCFLQGENITEPEKVSNLMGFKGFLFNSTIPVSKFNFRVERNVKERLFKKALESPTITEEALQYLHSIDYLYNAKQLMEEKDIPLTAKQIEIILGYPKTAKLLQDVGCKCVKDGKVSILNVIGDLKDLYTFLNEDFDIEETPKKVKEYIKACGFKCICEDIPIDKFLPCRNAIILSKEDPLSSLTEFCRIIDSKDTFVIRMNLRKASEKLNKSIEDNSVSASEYLRELGNIRRTIRSVLGKGYESYIELILQAGTHKERFLQELLQNADDCEYPANVIPEFYLSQTGNSIITEYNEMGFNRANIRSITAIGESTKKKLLEQGSIGNKGVGFKTIFAIASEVRIQSGEYYFALTDKEPTIPRTKNLKPIEMPFAGTRMEFDLKDQSIRSVFTEQMILALCLCLRKLKRIKIFDYGVTISDYDNRRVITINGREYSLRRFNHNFSVNILNRFKDSNQDNKLHTNSNKIVCFIPERNIFPESEYSLYNGLPTLHKIKIPIVIDAPFELTTSREEINFGNTKWNDLVRKELYVALKDIINDVKQESRSSIFRFMRFEPRREGARTVYHNKISNCDYLNDFDFLSMLRRERILPTFKKEIFATPIHKTAYIFPDLLNNLFRELIPFQNTEIDPATVIDVEGSEYDSALSALACEPAPFSKVFPIIAKHVKHLINNDKTRQKLYEYLEIAPNAYKKKLQELEIIPVYGKQLGVTEYIAWSDDNIFVKRGAVTSDSDYYILNEKLLSKSKCEKIFDVNINEMNIEWEHSRYNAKLKEILQGNDINNIYIKLLNEFKNGSLQKNNSFDILYANSNLIPLKNELGIIVKSKLYLCDKPDDFPVKLLQRIIVNRECKAFAEKLRCQALSEIHYENLNCSEQLTEDDIEALSDDYFKNSEEILRGFYREGLLSEKLLMKYELGYITFGPNVEVSSYVFPSKPVVNRDNLVAHIQKLLKNPVKIVPVKVERIVKKGERKDGTTFDLDIKDAREGALWIYTPEGALKQCYCQMCHKVKDYKLMEVNNIEMEPEYYFPQLRIALCLECSKRFEEFRKNAKIRKRFISNIKNAKINNQGRIDVSIKDNDVITFTAVHLAEVQEILNRKPQMKNNNT